MPSHAFVHPVAVRYLEVDRQGVVFHMWYLAYFDDAMTAYLAAVGAPYDDLLGAGLDVQLVHTEIDWTGRLGFGDDAAIAVSTERVGTTSFTLRFTALRSAAPVAAGRTVYVVVAADGSGKRDVPDTLRAALSRVVG